MAELCTRHHCTTSPSVKAALRQCGQSVLVELVSMANEWNPKTVSTLQNIKKKLQKYITSLSYFWEWMPCLPNMSTVVLDFLRNSQNTHKTATIRWYRVGVVWCELWIHLVPSSTKLYSAFCVVAQWKTRLLMGPNKPYTCQDGISKGFNCCTKWSGRRQHMLGCWKVFTVLNGSCWVKEITTFHFYLFCIYLFRYLFIYFTTQINKLFNKNLVS